MFVIHKEDSFQTVMELLIHKIKEKENIHKDMKNVATGHNSVHMGTQ